MAKLFWLQPDNSIVEFPLRAEQSLIGRSSRCDVCIKHPGISAEHAVIRRVAGTATVEDLGSTNGTRVNGKRLTQMHTLRHGDQIGVGRERLMYFAELDSAASFLQPQSVEPFAVPAPVRERVNTAPDPGPAAVAPAALMTDLPLPEPAAIRQSPPMPAARPILSTGGELVLDSSLIAALPKGAALATGGPPVVTAAVPHPRTNQAGDVQPPPRMSPEKTAASSSDEQEQQSLVGSVAVLSGPAVGKRYPLTSTSVTLGKEGKQVVAFIRASPTRWQISQREGVTPAYINGDALEGVRELAAGDVIELTGVRLRFEITLSPK